MSLASENEARELFLSGGDLRQLFARDTRESDAAPLVYLPEGQAETFRSDCAAGHLICPYPECERPEYVPVGGTGGRRHHFRHRGNGSGGHAKERWFHLVGKQLLADWARTAHPGITTALEVSLPQINRRADALATAPSGRRFALEVQYAGIDFEGQDGWLQRDDDYRSIGITPIWVFGHIRPHLVPGRGYIVPGEVKTTALFEQILEAGRGPVHLINPDTRQIARLLTWDDVIAVREFDDGTRPAYGYENALLGVAPLADCRLTPGGLRSPWDQRVDDGHDLVRRRVEAERAREEEDARRAREREEQRQVRAAQEQERHAEERRTLRQRLAEGQARAERDAAVARGRIRNVGHPALDGDGPSVGNVPSEAWRILLYLAVIDGRVGRDVRSMDFYVAAKKILPAAEKKARASAVTDWIFELRSLRLLDFASIGRFVVGPIAVVGEIDRPAPEDFVQRRRAMTVYREDDEYMVVDRARGALFIFNANGKHLETRPLNPKASLPAPPKPQRASDAEWKATERAERFAHAPAWVTQRLSTDARVPCPPVEWHGAVWDAHINGQVGVEKSWDLLMGTFLACAGVRRNVHAEDALLGFLAHLQRHRAVKFETQHGRPPDRFLVTSGGAVARP